jgi:putative two-component system response regulator
MPNGIEFSKIVVHMKTAPQYTILIADDDRASQKILESLLIGEGYKVICAGNGEEAVQRVNEDRPDICVLDIDMPKLNGVEACRQIKTSEDSRLTPVIMLTGMSPEQEKLNALESGCDDFLTNPLGHSELVARIKSLLRVKTLTDALEDAEVVLFTLARTIEAKDRYTLGHADRVGRYAVALGKALGFDADKIELLRKGGILHDIGKIGVPDSILQKEGPLDVNEWGVMRKHPTMGCEICQRLKGMKDIIPIIRHHHERLDGTGYPDGIKGAKIPDVVRIVNIVDIYDALTTRRSYKEAFPAPKAFRILWEEVERGWWDGDILKVWEGMIRKNKAVL